MVLHKGSYQGVPDDLRSPFLEDEAEPDTLIDLLVHRALRRAGDQAFVFQEDVESVGDFVDYAGLDERARDVAAKLQMLGVETGERVLLFYPPGLDYAAAFLGCLYAGVVAVPAYPPRLNRPISRLRSIAVDSGATVALTISSVLSNLEKRLAHAPEMRSLRWLSTDDGENLAEAWRRPEVNADTLAFLQYTSGSTSLPKGVMVTHGNLLHNLALIYHSFGHSAKSHMVSWLPPYHDMGLIVGMLQPLYGGFPSTLMPPASFMQRPLGWLQAISHTGADSAGAPNFAYDLCARVITPEERATLDLSGWKLAFSGAEPIRRETLERFAETFSPCGFRWEAFYPAYGLAEATVFVSGGKRANPPVVLSVEGAELERDRVAASDEGRSPRSIVGCGRAPADQEIVVVDPKALTVCPPDRVGEVWVSGPSVTQGYWGRPEETKDTFGAYLADTGEGPFLRTGDLGFLRQGELFITGRLNDLIIVRGRNHYPQDIELTAEQGHAALRPDCSAAFSVDIDGDERLVIVHELERSYVKSVDANEVASAVRSAVADLHELETHTVVLVRTGSIPKTSSGKIQRRATRAAYLEGALPVVAADELLDETGGQVTEEAGDLPAPEVIDEAGRVLDRVGDFVRRRGRSEPVRTSDSLRGDLGLDSLAIAELLMDLEAAFEVRLGDSVIADSRTAEDVVDEVLRARQTDSGGKSESDGIAGLQERIFRQIPQLGAVVSEQDGRNVKIGDRWYADFASANYLGLDLHPDVLAAIPDAIRRWGVHPSWTRAVASPQIYDDLERELADLVGVPDVLVFPTITLLHNGVLPVLAGSDGVILLDRAAHTSMQEAAHLAKAQGAAVDWFDHNDPQDLERVLEFHQERSRKIIAVDGVYSMSGEYPPLTEFAWLARKHGARVYVDDAHGIGVVGENPTPGNPYGDRGNGIVRHLGLHHGKEIVYVGGMSKAFSSMAAFVSCSDEDEKRGLTMASTAVFSGPCPTASLASALTGLKISRGDEGFAIRLRLLRLTKNLVDGVRALGFTVDNNEMFPLVGVKIGDVNSVVRACNVLWDHGILLTPALYPAVPMEHGALRFTVTAANTEEQVQRAIEGLRRVHEEVFPHDGHPSALAAPEE